MIQGLWRQNNQFLIQLRVFCCIICLSSGLYPSPFKSKSGNLTYNVLTDQIHFNMDYIPKARTRKRRNVMQMARMLKCMSGCNPLSYRGYGCYCGYMGSGQPVDEIDRCCLQHDWCYAFISCPQTLIYFVPYTWQCMNPGTAHCSMASVPGVSQECATQLCECDREFARCVSKFPCPRKKPGCKTSNYVILQTVSNNDV